MQESWTKFLDGRGWVCNVFQKRSGESGQQKILVFKVVISVVWLLDGVACLGTVQWGISKN